MPPLHPQYQQKFLHFSNFHALNIFLFSSHKTICLAKALWKRLLLLALVYENILVIIIFKPKDFDKPVILNPDRLLLQHMDL